MIIDKLNIISELLSQNQDLIICEANRIYVTPLTDSVEKNCKAKDIPTEKQGDRLLVKVKSYLNNIQLVCYEEVEKYFENDILDNEFAIIGNNGNYCYHSTNNNEFNWNVSVNPEFVQGCKNLFAYYKLYNFLISEDFADHHNDANTEIVIYSSAKGIFRIVYNSVPEIEKTNDITNDISTLIDVAEPVQIRSFIKNALFTFSNGKGIISINDIIKKSQEIAETAKRDFELASKQFDFEKFKDSLFKEKENYFNSIREIVNKIFSQAIGIPISISATVFATYEVKDDTIMLLIVLLAFFLYVCFYIKIQLVYKSDISELNQSFIRDFEIIKTKSGLPESSINNEKNKIDRKICNSLLMINWLIGVVIGLGLLVALYIIYEISLPQTTLPIN